MKKWTDESIKNAWIRNGVKNGYIEDHDKILFKLFYGFIGLGAGILITVLVTALF